MRGEGGLRPLLDNVQKKDVFFWMASLGVVRFFSHMKEKKNCIKCQETNKYHNLPDLPFVVSFLKGEPFVKES